MHEGFTFAQNSFMKLISWNVNGVRASVRKGLYEVIHDFDADVFCMQETKAQDEEVIESLAQIERYESVVFNSAERKGYSGTCIMSKEKPVATSVDIGIGEHDMEGRVTHCEFEQFHFVNVYVPNSGSGLKRLDYREEWDKAFANYLEEKMKTKPLILTGDLNVAHTELDLKNPKSNYNKTAGFTQVEIDGLQRILDLGLVDSFRTLYPEEIKYSFWNQRFRARDTNAGWRIDYFLVDERLWDKVTDAQVYSHIYGSDHCPVGLDINL